MRWDAAQHESMMSPVDEWQRHWKIPAHRILVGEWGVWRKAHGAQAYVADVGNMFNQRGWSWSYYAFRENQWDVVDLEKSGARPERRTTPLMREMRRVMVGN